MNRKIIKASQLLVPKKPKGAKTKAGMKGKLQMKIFRNDGTVEIREQDAIITQEEQNNGDCNGFS